MATNSCWIDAKTGNRVGTGPPGWSPTGASPNAQASNPDPNHVEYGGHTFVNDPNKGWIDAATGDRVRVGPPGWSPIGASPNAQASNPDPNHVEYGGHTFVRIPCPPATPSLDGRPHIVDAPSAAQAGDTIRVRVTGANPFDSTFWIDNRKVEATGITGDTATLVVPVGAGMGAHQLVLRSHDQESVVKIHLVTLTADPLGTTEPGVAQTVTVHVEGLNASDVATMYFKTADPAQFASGKPLESAPVIDGIATTTIVGIHEGRAVIQFKLVVAPRPN